MPARKAKMPMKPGSNAQMGKMVTEMERLHRVGTNRPQPAAKAPPIKAVKRKKAAGGY